VHSLVGGHARRELREPAIAQRGHHREVRARGEALAARREVERVGLARKGDRIVRMRLRGIDRHAAERADRGDEQLAMRAMVRGAAGREVLRGRDQQSARRRPAVRGERLELDREHGVQHRDVACADRRFAAGSQRGQGGRAKAGCDEGAARSGSGHAPRYGAWPPPDAARIVPLP